MRIVEKAVGSSDGINTLRGKVYIPEGAPKGLFHVVHGMTEHIGRYDLFMSEMCEDGYIVFGYDHLGHGLTAKEGDLGFIAHKDGWKLLVDDVGVFADAVAEEYGKDLPRILFGHSMGSFIVRLYAAKEGEKLSKLIVCGTGGPNPAAGAGIAMARVIKALRGERHISKTMYKLAFGTYNKKWPDEGATAWITNDISVREKYESDRFCTFKFTVSAMEDLVKLNGYSSAKSTFDGTPKSLPVFLISGENDPVGNYGEGVKKVYELYKKAGIDAKIKLYSGARHEILNDFTHGEAVNDIKEFIK
ncbi:MAG: lysophospholipase [Clostridia bacterium]|nr:lysophospholipase [Clostridia bacterium]